MKGFTGIKDVDMEILLKIDDRYLLNTCLTNKYINNICKDENFWRKRFFNKYGDVANKIVKPEDRSWKDHYLQVLIYLDYFTDKLEFLRRFKLGNKGILNSIYIDLWGKINTNLYEWIVVNYYLLTFGNKLDIEVEKGNHITPFTLENPEGISLSQIADKVLSMYELEDNQLIEFHAFRIPNQPNMLIYASSMTR